MDHIVFLKVKMQSFTFVYLTLLHYFSLEDHKNTLSQIDAYFNFPHFLSAPTGLLARFQLFEVTGD